MGKENNNLVEVEIEKNKFLIIEEDRAIELAIQEYYKGNQVKINNRKFDIFNFGNYKEKLVMEN